MVKNRLKMGQNGLKMAFFGQKSVFLRHFLKNWPKTHFFLLVNEKNEKLYIVIDAEKRVFGQCYLGLKKLAHGCIIEPQCTNVTLLILRGKTHEQLCRLV